MDELTIDEKKYVSSKRAAEITGYAKDYVGQLCRDGYVEAKRVGRNWYVLESAIKDHRFGGARHDAPRKAEPVTVPKVTPSVPAFTIEHGPEPAPEPKKEEAHTDIPIKTWIPAKYEHQAPPELPSINLLRKEGVVEGNGGHEEPKLTPKSDESVHEAWQSWFDTFNQSLPRSDERHMIAEAQHVVPDKGGEEVKINVVQAPLGVPVRPLEIRMEDAIPEKRYQLKASKPARGVEQWVATAITGVITVVCLVLIAANLGKFDSKIISDKRGYYISGISIYDKH